MNRSNLKPFKSQYYDISNPTARTSQSKILTARGIKLPTLLAELPRSKFPYDKNSGEILGVKLRIQDPVVTELPIKSEPVAETIVKPVVAINEVSDEEVSDDIIECSSMPVRSPGRPKKPINRDATIVKLYELMATSKKANDEIAQCFEDLMDHRTNTQVKKKDIPEWLRLDVWQTQFENRLDAKCPCCSQRDISKDSFSTGHIIPESCGGSMSLNNLMAICKECNTRMGTHHLYWFAWRYYSKIFWQI